MHRAAFGPWRMGGRGSLMLGRLFPLAWPSPEPPRGVGCSECLSCPRSSEASSWDAGQCSPLFLSSWFLQGARGSTAASTVLQAPRGRTERECVRPQSQPETGEVAPPRTSEVGSSHPQEGGAGCRPPVPPPGGLRVSPLPPLSFPPPRGGQPWQATCGRRAGLSFHQCRCHISCASEPTATSEPFLTLLNKAPGGHYHPARTDLSA